MKSEPKEVRAQTPENEPAKKAFVQPELERHETLPEVTGATIIFG